MSDTDNETTTTDGAISDPTKKGRVSDATPEGDIPDATPEGSDLKSDPDDADADEMFPAEVVRKLRDENAKYRTRAKAADTYAERLHRQMVTATGRLADPTDLEFAEEHLDDTEALTAAIDDLLARKPHLASRKPVGDIGQGQRGSASEPFSLLGLLKERT